MTPPNSSCLSRIPVALVAACVALAAAWPGDALAQAGRGGQRGPGGPTEVGVMTASRAQVPVTVTLPGRAVAYQQAAITPKVGGEVQDVAYDPGSQVKAGTVLFRLEDETISAQLNADIAAVDSAQSAVEGAQATVNRYERLKGSGVSQAELETAQVALSNAKSALAGANAQRDLTQLSLERTEIRSPIDGIVDIAQVSEGDIVSAGPQTVLTTVTQLDPIYVDVAESRARVLRNRARQAEGTLQRLQGPAAKLVLETGQVYDGGGVFVSPGIAVSQTTGTVPIRIRFANPNRLILPGQFVRVEIQVGTVDGVLVPQRATSRSADGSLTAFVVRDGKADEIELTESGTTRNSWIVTEGIAAGDLLVLDGLDNLRDGAAVTTVPVAIDDEGVVRDVDAASGEAAQPETSGTGGGGGAAGGADSAVGANSAAGGTGGSAEGGAAGSPAGEGAGSAAGDSAGASGPIGAAPSVASGSPPAVAGGAAPAPRTDPAAPVAVDGGASAATTAPVATQ